MPRYVALLRSVNVGGRSLSMAKLREVAESLGHSDVSTYIQSGNLLFTSKRAVTATQLERAIAKEFAIDVPVMLRTAAELQRVIRDDPFPSADRSKVHVGFMAGKPPAAAIKQIDHERFLPEEVVVKGCELYFHLPNGMGRSKLPIHAGQKLKVPTTVRNWNTVTKLLALLDA